jgi:hypothetical protein
MINSGDESREETPKSGRSRKANNKRIIIDTSSNNSRQEIPVTKDILTSTVNQEGPASVTRKIPIDN